MVASNNQVKEEKLHHPAYLFQRTLQKPRLLAKKNLWFCSERCVNSLLSNLFTSLMLSYSIFIFLAVHGMNLLKPKKHNIHTQQWRWLVKDTWDTGLNYTDNMGFPDIWKWLCSLPRLDKWESSLISLELCASQDKRRNFLLIADNTC